MSSLIAELIELVQKLPEDCLDETLEYINTIIEEKASTKPRPPCPHCKSLIIVRFGHYKSKQRYRCDSCRRVFLDTTKTALKQSHFGESVWKQVIRDTLDGESMDSTAASLDITHQTAFHMRHKILLALEICEKDMPTVLDGVCESDDTYVLESMKGTEIPDDHWRPARRHGAKSYGVLDEKCKCEVSNVKNQDEGHAENSSFFNINTANSLHSLIKSRYTKYKGVATKYLNRYNVLFSKAFICGENAVDEIYNILISSDLDFYNSIEDVKTANLLDL